MKGLGKGLSALLGTSPEIEDKKINHRSDMQSKKKDHGKTKKTDKNITTKVKSLNKKDEQGKTKKQAKVKSLTSSGANKTQDISKPSPKLDKEFVEIKEKQATRRLEEKVAEEYVFLPIMNIIPNPKQPRRQFNEENLRELAESIRNNGLIQPIIVTPHTNKENVYVIVAGERRWRASQMAGLHRIPVIIRSLSDINLMKQALIENVQREDLNPIDEAKALQALRVEYGLTQEILASVIGKSRPAITNSLRLLQLSEYVQNLIQENQLSAGHARALLGTEEQKLQDELAKLVVEKQLSVRQVEMYIRKHKETVEVKTSKEREGDGNPVSEALLLQLQAIENQLIQHLQTKVKIQNKSKGGSIVINYYSHDELEHILEAMGLSS